MERGVISLLALRNLAYRPWRSLLLLVGYGLGVGVMIVLLAIGEALLTQARDEKLVGGGEITVLPEGLDVEVMKTGGVGGLYFSIDRARFVYLQLLAAPRLAGSISAVAPQIDGKLLYLRTADGREIAVRATGEIPSRTRLVGAAPVLARGAWTDDEGDRRWIAPTPRELYSGIDHFHLPPREVENRESWGEWHYFNVLSADRRRWAFISFLIGGDVPRGEWGGQILVSVREQGGRTRKFVATVPKERIRFSTTDPDLSMGSDGVRLLDDGRYALRAHAREEGGRAHLALDLVLTPTPRAYFPGSELASGAFTSGYAVAALRGAASGTLCIDGACERYDGAQAYHDHNWGVWRGVSWEWGAARAGDYTFLYGRVNPPDSTLARPPFFLYLVDSLGFRAIFRPRAIDYDDSRTIVVNGRELRVPARAVFADARGDDTLRVELTIEDAIGTDTRLPLIERGDLSAARRLTTPYFIQMKGLARLTGRLDGRPVSGEGTGFFETYR
ncbi:MAG TPA: hypothetical protein VFS05_08250 [Gemmatimonadaceae bacterium]|nr:hypothetical protein [Gemmatimonadaceae bacterium]